MGGYGCGGKNQTHDYTSRYKTLDSFMFGQCIPIMERKGMEQFENSYRWNDGSSIGVILYPDRLWVGYSWTHQGKREEIRDTFYFDTVPNNYGGQRYYFSCPSCGRRCRLLYHHRVRFKCRQCARLNYSSQQVTKGPDEAAHRLNQFLRNKFGQDKRLSPMELTYLLPPDRPKGMHQKTYERLLREYDQLYSQYDRAFVVHALKTLPFLAQAIQRQSVA